MSPRRRVNLTFDADELQQVEQLARAWSKWLPTSTSVKQMLLALAENPTVLSDLVTSGNQREPAVTSGNHPQGGSGQGQRARADVRVDDVSQSVSEKGDERTNEPTPEQLLAELPWYGAKLSKASTPESFVQRIKGSCPSLTRERIAAELWAASGWLEDHPAARKQYLGRFLMAWMKRATNGFKGKPKRRLKQAGFELPETTDNQWMEGTDNARFED
jgi:hypothetical protein